MVYLVRNDGGRGKDEGGSGPCPHHRPPHQRQGQEGVRQEFQALHPGIRGWQIFKQIYEYITRKGSGHFLKDFLS